MKKYISILIAAISIAVVASTIVAAQSATVSIARKKLYSGLLGPVKIFIDGEFVCELKNNTFSVHSLSVGEHKFSVQWSGKKSKEDATVMEIDMRPGKEYYFKTDTEIKGLFTFPILEEVTENSWPKIVKDLEKITCPQNGD